MNYKSLIAIVAVLILLNVGFFYFLKGKNQTNKLPLPTYQTSNTSTTKTLNLPTEPYQTGIDSVKVLYSFSGKVTEVKSFGDNLKTLKLGITVTDAPEFTTNPRTLVFKIKDDKSTPARVEDIQPGQTVSLTEAYNIKTQAWELEIILIRE